MQKIVYKLLTCIILMNILFQFNYSIINLKGTDRRCDWDWLLKVAHAPDVVISDRLEILFDYLKTIGKRSLD